MERHIPYFMFTDWTSTVDTLRLRVPVYIKIPRRKIFVEVQQHTEHILFQVVLEIQVIGSGDILWGYT